MDNIRQKVITIVGPTASGKSAWAVRLAKKFNGVIISADSRQVYQGLDIVTAKITRSEMQGIPHYLLDVVKPAENFDVATYQNLVYAILAKITEQNQTTLNQGGRSNSTYRKIVLPIIAGGTGLYVQAVTDGYVFPDVKPDKKLRAGLEKQPLPKLAQRLKKLDPEIQIDFRNPRRVIRALEIAIQRGSRPAKKDPGFDTLKIGIKLSLAEQEKRIQQRIKKIDFDKLAAETRKLMRAGFAPGPRGPQARWDFESNPLTALYYRFVRDFLEKKITKKELVAKLIRADRQYAKRQMTWFKKDPQIHWVDSPAMAKSLVRHFLNP